MTSGICNIIYYYELPANVEMQVEREIEGRDAPRLLHVHTRMAISLLSTV